MGGSDFRLDWHEPESYIPPLDQGWGHFPHSTCAVEGKCGYHTTIAHVPMWACFRVRLLTQGRVDVRPHWMDIPGQELDAFSQSILTLSYLIDLFLSPSIDNELL